MYRVSIGVASIAAAGAAWLILRPKATAVLRQTLFGGRAARCIHAAAGAAQGAPKGHLSVLPAEYPEVRRDDTVDVLHGIRIEDPYRWLEDASSPETEAFVEVQNELTSKVLAQCQSRDTFKELMTDLYNYPRYGCPFKRGDRYYYSHNTGLQQQSVMFTQRTLDAEASVLIDPNTLSDDGTVALMGTSFSESGELMAYRLSAAGSDWQTMKVMRIDAETGATTNLPDVLERVKFSSCTWTHDDKGLFYNTYPEHGESEGATSAHTNQRLMYHVLGTPQAEDVVVLAIPEEPEWMIGAEVSHDGRYLLLTISAGCEPTNRVWFFDLDSVPKSNATGALDFTSFDFVRGDKKLPLVKLVDDFRAQYSYVHSSGSSFIFHTNLDAPRYRIVRADLNAPGPPDAWPDVVPQHAQDLLQWVSALKGALALAYLHDVKAQLELRDPQTGQLMRRVPLPGVGSVSGFSGSHKHSEFFFNFTNFSEPGATFVSVVADGDAVPPKLFRRTPSKGFSADDFETKQVFVASKDGTKVPMFIVHRRGLVLNGSNPTLLYGYGGFNISLESTYSVARMCWMLAFDGVYCVANLRGGGEYGREWRDAGSLKNKQNVFDDFIACAEWLSSSGYTAPSKLTIQGGSNGGLLVAACANQRPDLFACILAQVGVMDMLRFHKFTIGHAWISDYGNPDKAEDFEYIYKYSPIHNVRRPEGGTQQYPAFFITTGDHDDRVVPAHSHKLTATLQHTLASDPKSPQRNPLLTRIEVRAGHGAGKPTDKIISEVSDMYAYAAKVCGAPWRFKKADGALQPNGS